MRAFLCLLALGLAACADSSSDSFDAATYDGGQTDETIDQSGNARDDVDAPEAPVTDEERQRPATETAMISIEGAEEPIDVRLVTVDEVPLPFSTYIPTGWVDDVSGSGEGTAVLLATSETDPRGFVSLFVPSEANREGIDGLADAVAESRGEVREADASGTWARRILTFSGIDEAGSIRIGEHAGVPFYILESFPVEMGDGFAPRAAFILDRLRWEDDGTSL